MAEVISAGEAPPGTALAPAAPPSLLAPFMAPGGGGVLARLGQFLRQPPVRRSWPWFAGVSALGLTALLWLEMAPQSQRVLYTELGDAERASVTAALDKAAISYRIDNQTGAITVGENDLYKARMVAASDGAIATPETGPQMLDKLPLGASRTMEAERIAAARERELELTVMQIEGVEAVRVHIAEPEKSVFVRDTAQPTASVMVRLARGRQLAASQVSAIVNLVAGSVPGLGIDAVRVVDQHGRLLSGPHGGDADRLEIQGRIEEKLRDQLAQLLTPMLGEGNFSSEVQVELDMDQQTSARESYDKTGAVRTETQTQSQSSGPPGPIGVPGVLSNTPPPPTTAQQGAPQGTPAANPSTPAQTSGESSTSRNYELGREVAVTTGTPGKIRRLTVAVALSAEAMAKARPAEIEQIKQLVSAAVGADAARGDQVAVAVRSFHPAVLAPPAFWEQPWFAMVVRNGVALLAVVLTLLLGVRPLVRALRREPRAALAPGGELLAADGSVMAPPVGALPAPADDEAVVAPQRTPRALLQPAAADDGVIDTRLLARQVGMAQRLVEEKPDTAVAVLRQMLREPVGEEAGETAS